MPQIIYPEISGTITVTMTVSEAKVLTEALSNILHRNSLSWPGNRILDETDGVTCNQLLRELKNVLE